MIITVLYEDGREEILAKNPSLDEMQHIVGGWIEYVPEMPRNYELVVNEEGRMNGLAENAKASAIWQTVLAKKLGVPVTELRNHVGPGKRLWYWPSLQGPAILFDKRPKAKT